jgi:Sensors of blue-light using FAD
MGLIQLIYVSNSLHEATAAELDDILASSARNNGAHQVTGMLLYAAGSFMQILEGEEKAVDETYDRVSRDPRHTNIFVLEREPIAERSFEQWKMGFKRLGAAEAAAHPAYAAFFEHGFKAADIGARPGLALDMLIDFGKTQRAGARI